MVPSAIFVGLVVLISSATVECGYASASSGSSSNSDGTGQTFTHTNNNGQQQSTSSAFPAGAGFNNQFAGAGGFPQQGFGQGFPQQGFLQPGFQQPGFQQLGFQQQGFQQPGFPQAGFPYYGPAGYNPANQYGPSFPYNQFPIQQPQFNAFQGYNTPVQPFASFGYQPTPQEFNNYLSTLKQQYAHGGVSTRTTPGATAIASSYLGPNKPNGYYNQQQALLKSWNNQANSQAYSPGQGQGNYAYATGAYGPNGIHQTAGVNPPNKNKPNIDTRFAADDSANAAGGFYGVSTGSFSSSSSVNGVEQRKDGAFTAVNNNGKVSTYEVSN